MKSSEQEQAFLDEVYRKARLLEYDKREAAKVLRNRKILARQKMVKFACVIVSTVVMALIIRHGGIEQGLRLCLSLLLIAAGIAVESMELSRSTEIED
ncbi:hypothetical protein JI735_21370 [Paenibacillus sonchi]|uniref:Uncharacterized protein n=1 Tax=Paenibacillus sonchi TaxID=373687 RepID=A0A974P9F8_9BACL|nr:hypothetical protein [Paenibacillus sonchi]MCE3200234.1 hypothetical protein [Paenibacillus sonchi]QQZ59228.1 hypothetical protein JI735_21370 [Paenibacillus sonchi]